MIARGIDTSVPFGIPWGEGDILARFLGITSVPAVISSPFREDRKPSFSLWSPDGRMVRWVDFATGDKGDLWDLLGRLWGLPFPRVIDKVRHDMEGASGGVSLTSASLSGTRATRHPVIRRERASLDVRVRKWESRDMEYWGAYGVTLPWLRWAEVYPVSHVIYSRDGHGVAFAADRLAYAFVERKEGRVTMKIYQPLNTMGFKWRNNHDGSVIALWDKIPERGKSVCVCSSVKDALCLSVNARMPAVALQGEGYGISETAASELRRRYERVYVLFDNDEAGLVDGEKLSRETGFRNVVLPPFDGGKDVSDLYKTKGREKWRDIIFPLFSE